jgi:hypothetical protein
MSRLLRRGDDPEVFDRAFWRTVDPETRLALVWEIGADWPPSPGAAPRSPIDSDRGKMLRANDF